MQLQARLNTMLNLTLKRTLQLAGLLALLTALVAPAGATTQKRQTTKKQQVTKPAVSKKQVTTRKTAQFVSGTKRKPVVRVSVPPKPSYGQIAGLHSAHDALDLKSSVALVIDQDTREVLFRKNDHAVLPIASLTKLMTGVIITGAKLPMDEMVTITQDDVDTEKGSSSRLKVGTSLTRGEMLHLALMSSENRAANALGRTYPGGLAVFVSLMNAKAKLLGMTDTRYVEPTGLSSRNQSSAQDLATLVSTAHADPVLRELSTSTGYQVAVGNRTLQYNNTNRLIKNPEWDIGLQKTGYISEAGQCLVMQTKIAGRKLIMVFLDSAGKLSRLGDAERVRRWVEANPIANPAASPVAAERKVNISM
jgi:serine-type D-Ala-D-Ala endopeptidase (penicillin-binding protein 7)